LIKHRRQQWLEGLPKEESRSETTSEEEGDDDDDDDAGSRYDTATTLAHLLDVRSLQEPVGEGSTSQASRAALAPIKGIYRAHCPTVNVSGAAPTHSVASDLVGGQFSDADA
jgi:hypothetical protein